ncbi:MAG: hypothetical protein HFACDABA_00417 [Anaerolineales bacterium]|nr:hypothetical protein [Anaerolineales bacterium]
MKKVQIILIALYIFTTSCSAQTTPAATPSAPTHSAAEQENMCDRPSQDSLLPKTKVIWMEEDKPNNGFLVTFSLYAGVYFLSRTNPCFDLFYAELQHALQSNLDVEFSYSDFGPEITYVKTVGAPPAP